MPYLEFVGLPRPLLTSEQEGLVEQNLDTVIGTGNGRNYGERLLIVQLCV